MRIHKALIKLATVPMLLASLAACSGKNSNAPFVVDSNGKHADNWLAQHFAAYKQQNGGSTAISSNTGCSECHGADLTGGISKVSCFSTSLNGVSCHATGVFGHAAAWADPTKAGFHSSAFASGLDANALGSAINTACAPCHSTDLSSDKGAGVPSCLTSNPKWGISCHTSNPKNGCSSCHSTPPAGSALPNRAGAHAAHLSLPGVTCATCHYSYGSGTVQHATARFRNHSTAFIKIPFAYKAETQTGSLGLGFSAGTCASVSCHGGQQTPDWNSSGSISIATDCQKCHQFQDPQNPQYNSFSSGFFSGAGVNLHQFHLQNGFFCTDCHNVDKLDNKFHFADLSTPGFEFPPGATIGGAQITAYDVTTQNCTNLCHTMAPNPANWNK